jgi:Tfp pilus assembly protein PilO
MNKTVQAVLQALNTLLAHPDKRRFAIAQLCFISLMPVMWIGINVHQTKKTDQATLALQQANQATLDKLTTEQKKQQAIEGTIKKRLANREDLNGLILSLESTAPAHSVILSDANQTYVQTSRTTLPHSLIQYNVQGSYANVLQFVAESLNKHDALVLKNLSFRRADPLVTNLQINLEWAFYYP